MWNLLSSFIIKFRILFLFIIAGVTFFMAQNAVNVEYSVERSRTNRQGVEKRVYYTRRGTGYQRWREITLG